MITKKQKYVAAGVLGGLALGSWAGRAVYRGEPTAAERRQTLVFAAAAGINAMIYLYGHDRTFPTFEGWAKELEDRL